MLINLKIIRASLNLSQGQFAALLGCTRSHYVSVECGRGRGSIDFWRGVQEIAAVPDSRMWELIRNTEKGFKTPAE